MIDSHCHLNDPRFAEDAPDAVARARAAGVTDMLVAGYDHESSDRARELAGLEGVWVALGVHPHDASSTLEDPDWLRRLEQEIANEPRAAAVGEAGLDYHYDLSPRDVQQQVFREQVRLAHRLTLPITIHSRAAEDDVLRILREEGMPEAGAVLHAFTGTTEQAMQAVELGMYIGVTGMVSFKKADDLRETLRQVGLRRLLLETDCPYLAPVPHRGKRNEPAYLPLVMEALAEALGEDRREVEESTAANTLAVFRRMR